MIPEGKHRARATQWALGTTGTGKEQIAVSFDLLDLGESITWYGYFTDAALARTIESMRHCGWQGADLDDLTGLDGNEVIVVVAHEEYNGQTRPKVRWVNAGGGLALKAQLSAPESRSFAARMKGAILALDQAAGRSAATAPAKPKAGAAPVTPDEEIPF